jgi:UDP-glucose 4-epimerase
MPGHDGEHPDRPDPMKIVVTGGAGFIGANLTRCLAAQGEEVVVVDDLSSGARRNLEGVGAEVLVGSILDDEVLDAAVIGAASIVHLAARASVPASVADPVACHKVNVTGTLSVLEAARRHGVGHVVLASSSAVYGEHPALPTHEGLAPAPASPYAASKLAAEAYALSWATTYGLRTLALRFFNVYGPLQPADHAYAAVVPAFVDAALAGRPLVIHGDGTQTRDFVDVGTVAGILARAATGGVAHERPVNLAFGTRTSLLELVAELEAILGQALPRRFTPRRAGDVPHSQADNARLVELFPDLEVVPLRNGLQATVEWFRAEPAPGTRSLPRRR